MESTLVPDLVAVLLAASVAAWIFHKIGVSRVLGYLIAGVIVGPFTRPVLVSDIGTIQSLADIGLVFVMFFIGLELSVRRLRALGITTVLITVMTALILFNGMRFFGGFFGFDRIQALFIAGTVMIASSVIVSRTFADLDVSREPFARKAMGMMLLEDAVAIVMLAILGAVGGPASSPGAAEAASSASATPAVAPLIVRLAGFVLLALIAALLFIPKLLSRLENYPREIMNVALGGLLLGLALLASSAGYSFALGAFLMGSVVGGTNYKERFHISFEGLHDIFAAVFYVSMGMLFDVSMALKSLPMALMLASFALVGRSLAATAAFLLTGHKLDFAIRAGTSITPLGEFAFVIAQMGAASGRMPETFFPGCVGAVFLTTLLSPYLCRLGGVMAPIAVRHTPGLLISWQHFLSRLEGGLSSGDSKARFLGKGLSKVCIQLGVQMAIVLSALAFGGPISRAVLQLLHAFSEPFEEWVTLNFGWHVEGLKLLEIGVWSIYSLILLIPCISIWRLARQVGSILADGLIPPPEDGKGSENAAQTLMRQAIARIIHLGGMLAFVLLAGAFFPQRIPATGRSVFIIAMLCLLALLLRASLTRWNSAVQEGLKNQMEGKDGISAAPSAAASEAVPDNGLVQAGSALASDEWSLKVREVQLSMDSQAAGMTIMETALRANFGCSIVAIDREGDRGARPMASTRLYPKDKLLLVGTEEQLRRAEEWLSGKSQTAEGEADSFMFSELTTESIVVPESFSLAGKTLAELKVASRFHVMVLGLEHEGEQSQNPSGDQRILAGDRLLVLGVPSCNRAFRNWFDAGSGETMPPMAAAPSV